MKKTTWEDDDAEHLLSLLWSMDQFKRGDKHDGGFDREVEKKATPEDSFPNIALCELLWTFFICDSQLDLHFFLARPN